MIIEQVPKDRINCENINFLAINENEYLRNNHYFHAR